jgi:hypothetical protein
MVLYWCENKGQFCYRNPDGGASLSTLAIVGVAVGGIAALVLLVWCCKKNCKDESTSPSINARQLPASSGANATVHQAPTAPHGRTLDTPPIATVEQPSMQKGQSVA